jgi:hypothetical protein
MNKHSFLLLSNTPVLVLLAPLGDEEKQTKQKKEHENDAGDHERDDAARLVDRCRCGGRRRCGGGGGAERGRHCWCAGGRIGLGAAVGKAWGRRSGRWWGRALGWRWVQRWGRAWARRWARRWVRALGRRWGCESARQWGRRRNSWESHRRRLARASDSTHPRRQGSTATLCRRSSPGRNPRRHLGRQPPGTGSPPVRRLYWDSRCSTTGSRRCRNNNP